jgi:hypothetical protein
MGYLMNRVAEKATLNTFCEYTITAIFTRET